MNVCVCRERERCVCVCVEIESVCVERERARARERVCMFFLCLAFSITVDVSSYYYICVLMLLYVSSCCDVCVRMPVITETLCLRNHMLLSLLIAHTTTYADKSPDLPLKNSFFFPFQSLRHAAMRPCDILVH